LHVAAPDQLGVVFREVCPQQVDSFTAPRLQKLYPIQSKGELAFGRADQVAHAGVFGAQRGELTDPPMTTIQQDMDRIAVSAVHWIREITLATRRRRASRASRR